MKKNRLTTLLLAALVAMVPAAEGQTVHVAGASGTSQFLTAALGADQLALAEIAANVAKGVWSPGEKSTFHWTAKNSANIIDNRDPAGRILPEIGNVFVVWIADSSDSTGNTNVTDIWAAESVDATVAVRAFSAQETTGSGAQLQIIPAVQGNLISPSSLWADGKADVSLIGVTNVSNTIGTSSTGAGDVHINVALTDLRPEDALYATTRALATLNTTTWSGLGYKGPTPNIGAPIFSAQGTGASSTPIKFALSGGTDPISHIAVPAYTTIDVGAAPFIFVLNNGGAFSSSTANFITGVGTKGPFPLAHLFDGTTTADTHNPAFGGNGDGAGTPLALILREPISAAASVVEFDEFRTTGNATDSQEVGVVNPTRAPYNPLNLPTPIHGSRQRANSTSEVVSALKNANTLGYIAFSFGNAAKLSGASWNYLTLDGVDPLAIPGTVNQKLPNGSVTAAASVWPSTPSFPSLRNGTYKLWSFERYLVANSVIGADPYGPDVLAQSEQDNVDQTVSDFVPFHTSSGSDGLDVYRSHFTQSGHAGNNGVATPPNFLDGGNTLGGGTEAGGDVGGAIEGPFGVPVKYSGTVNTTKTLTAGKGYRVTWTAGEKFTAGTAWEGLTITINGSNYTVADVAVTSTALYVTTNPNTQTHVAYDLTATTALAAAPGVLNKKQ
jgi:hypothetical protein